MSEVLLAPTAVAGIAVAIKFTDLLSGWMTGAAFEFIVILIKNPACSYMIKCRFPFGVMAMAAISY